MLFSLSHTHISHLRSILQTWRWACEGSGSRFGPLLSKVGVDRWQAERQDVMSSRPVTLPPPPPPPPPPPASSGQLPQAPSFYYPPTPTPPLFLSTSLLSCFFCRSKWWLCYIHLFFLCNYETVQRNQIETTWRRTLCIFAYSVYETARTLQSQTDVFAFCIISRSSCP